MVKFDISWERYQTKKGLMWRVRLREGRKKGPSKGGFKTKAEGKAWAVQKELEIVQQQELAEAEAKRTIHTGLYDAYNDYLSWGQPRWRKNTYYGKKAVFVRFLGYLTDHHPDGLEAPLKRITSAFMEEYMYWLAEQDGCSTKTSNRHKREVGAVFNHARRRGVLKGLERVKERDLDNPCRDIEPFAEDEYNRPVPTFETVELYRGEAKGDEADYIELLCNTIQRGISIRRLKWEHVHFAERRVGFRHKKRDGGGYSTVWVHMNKTVHEILKRRFEERETDSPYVFINKYSGERLFRRSSFIKNLFHRIRARLNERLDTEVELVTGHALRHWGARMLDEMGYSEKRIGNLLDHQNEATTRIYLEKMRVDEDLADGLEQIRNEKKRKPNHLKVVK